MTYTVYTKWLAESLMNQGHQVIKTKFNVKRPGFLCWEFEATPTFFLDMKRIVTEK